MKVKIDIPSSKNEIRLSQHQRFIKAIKDVEDAEYINRQMVASLCNLDDKIVTQMVRKDFNDIVNQLSKVLMEESKLKPIIKHNGVKYGLIPDFMEMTVGEQADLDTLYGDYNKRQKVMAILYRPITVESKGKYLIEDYTGKEKELDLPLDIVDSVHVFFCNILKDCMNITLNYIKQEEVQRHMSKTLQKNGAGIKTFMPLVEETYSSLMKQLNYQ